VNDSFLRTRNIAIVIASVVALALGSRLLGAQDWACDEPADREVMRLSFTGNHVYSDAVLRNGIFTEPSSTLRRWFRFVGARRCLDPDEFVNDVRRIQLLYYKTGYRDVRVDTIVKPLARRAIDVTFTIVEGPPTLVESLTVLGIENLPERDAVMERLTKSRLQVGMPYNTYALAALADTIQRTLRNAGYPTADVFRGARTDTLRHAFIELDVEPGTRARIGEIEITVQPQPGEAQQISTATVRNLLNVHEGDPYREAELERAKRNLYLTDAYRAVAVNLDSLDAIPPGDSAVKLHVNLAEGPMRTVRGSGGWGTLDCFRSEGEFRHNNFLHSARRLELRTRVSKVGIGSPLGGFRSLCWSSLARDPYSTRLNYYAGFTVREPKERAFGLRPSVTLYTERRGEYFAYLRTTQVGLLLSASREIVPRRTQNLSYQIERGRTEAQPAVFCALQSVCLPEDRASLQASRWIATASWSIRKDWSDDPQYPTRGGVARAELRHASSVIGSDKDVQFSKATADGSMYIPIGRSAVLAGRLQLGAVVGPAFSGVSRFIPPQERLFAGGSNTVRGYSQNDLGPKAYIASGYDTVQVSPDTAYFRTGASRPQRSVPTGGSALAVGNLELRMASPVLPTLLRWVAFVDAGELWSPGAPQAENRFQSVKVTPGIGVRITTPVGPFRVDVAYRPYQPRPGSVFFDTPVQLGGQLYCVSPDNTLPVTGVSSSGGVPTQATGPCPATYRPDAPTSFLRRLQLQLGIGQAF
jgi:outer membrane protein assembly factor BamA